MSIYDICRQHQGVLLIVQSNDLRGHPLSSPHKPVNCKLLQPVVITWPRIDYHIQNIDSITISPSFKIIETSRPSPGAMTSWQRGHQKSQLLLHFRNNYFVFDAKDKRRFIIQWYQIYIRDSITWNTYSNRVLHTSKLTLLELPWKCHFRYAQLKRALANECRNFYLNKV